MLRAAAKNWPDVAVVIDPADYPRVLAELKAGGVQRDHEVHAGARRCSRTPPPTTA